MQPLSAAGGTDFSLGGGARKDYPPQAEACATKGNSW